MQLQARVSMPKGVSANEGVLVYDTDSQKLSYVKFLEQASGRVNIIGWVIIKIFRFVRRRVQEDKVLFELDKNEISNLNYVDGGMLPTGKLEFSTPTDKYRILFRKEDREDVSAIVDALK